MFDDMIDLNGRMRESMQDPALALRNGLARFPDKIKKAEENLKELRKSLDQLKRDAAARSRENRRGIFGGRKEPGFFASLGEDLDKSALDGTRSDITRAEAELQRLREFSNELKQPSYPADKQWTFDEVDQEITRLYNQFAGAHSIIDQASSMSREVATMRQHTPVDRDNPWASILGSLQKISAVSRAAGAWNGMEEVLLRMCKLTLELNNLYAIRRGFLPALLHDMRTWDKMQITAELQRRNRDLSELLSESEVLERQLSDFSAGLSMEMVKRSPLYAAFGEQRRFLQDIVFELEAALERFKSPQKPPDPTAETLDQIRELRRKMEAVLANETDPDLRAVIKQAYGKKIDALSEKL